MKWRKISEDDIGDVVNNPDYFEYSVHGRINAFKMIQGRLLKIWGHDPNSPEFGIVSPNFH